VSDKFFSHSSRTTPSRAENFTTQRSISRLDFPNGGHDCVNGPKLARNPEKTYNEKQTA
jgi:hypothetical protein